MIDDVTYPPGVSVSFRLSLTYNVVVHDYKYGVLRPIPTNRGELCMTESVPLKLHNRRSVRGMCVKQRRHGSSAALLVAPVRTPLFIDQKRREGHTVLKIKKE